MRRSGVRIPLAPPRVGIRVAGADFYCPRAPCCCAVGSPVSALLRCLNFGLRVACRPRLGCVGVTAGGGPPARRPRREPAARRVGSKPGQAPPPPTVTAAGARSRHALSSPDVARSSPVPMSLTGVVPLQRCGFRKREIFDSRYMELRGTSGKSEGASLRQASRRFPAE